VVELNSLTNNLKLGINWSVNQIIFIGLIQNKNWKFNTISLTNFKDWFILNKTSYKILNWKVTSDYSATKLSFTIKFKFGYHNFILKLNTMFFLTPINLEISQILRSLKSPGFTSKIIRDFSKKFEFKTFYSMSASWIITFHIYWYCFTWRDTSSAQSKLVLWWRLIVTEVTAY
jgi:hypothetical protein